jgi:hypothetical protein
LTFLGLEVHFDFCRSVSPLGVMQAGRVSLMVELGFMFDTLDVEHLAHIAPSSIWHTHSSKTGKANHMACENMCKVKR